MLKMRPRYFFKVRSVLFATKELVEKELDGLKKENVIIEILNSEWTTPKVG